MSDLKKKYNETLKKLENNIENPKDLECAKEQVKNLAVTFINEIEKIEELTSNQFTELSKKQAIVEAKVAYLEKTLNGIEKDIYDIDDNYDLEIVCPYCNYEFVLDEDMQGSEIECPECENIIEIDWEGESFEEGCHGHCSSCGSQCGIEDETKNNDEDNEDDM